MADPPSVAASKVAKTRVRNMGRFSCLRARIEPDRTRTHKATFAPLQFSVWLMTRSRAGADTRRPPSGVRSASPAAVDADLVDATILGDCLTAAPRHL